MKLKNKVAVITGGARDIGRATSLKLAREGAKVVINYFQQEELAKETLELIKQQGGEAIIVHGDMTKAADVSNLINKAREAFGDEIHILVNVAGGLVARKTITEMDEEFWDFVMDLNLKSVFLVSRETVPYMPQGSAIINFTSLAGRDGGGPGASVYATAKGALMTYTRSLAKELGPKGIRVNAVAPGMIATTFHDVFTKPEVRANVANATPLKREGRAEEVADLVAYLASDESSFITGTNIDINGGVAFS
ncbi:3-oxoacyl-ACP reductase FabG [Pedobacter sp. BS3]|uniref:SDR family NAD(P)-dependent oxidoreductase n=1 Tax=Pedobacter sp. BS3 TaxID=2567937 RepID=UPI0011F04F52|nr:3-oxoacyl-ACP reductase family protein [Pedobacter sp. BS3]TZF83583.1 3-oxoacyl-ACP reductase FabG [Pedobacter sp. BS3]